LPASSNQIHHYLPFVEIFSIIIGLHNYCENDFISNIKGTRHICQQWFSEDSRPSKAIWLSLSKDGATSRRIIAGTPYIEKNGVEKIKEYNSSSWASGGFCSSCDAHLFYKLNKKCGYVTADAIMTH
jgi:hypothetical protein|tara:strand:+ start:7463 stop:7843 length:381 start_codon:yes stop_codon:yes gene_type:complete